MEKELSRMEEEIKKIARDEGLENVDVEWGDPPILRSPEGKPIEQVDGFAAKVKIANKSTLIIFDTRELRDFVPQSEPGYLQKIREKIKQHVRELE